MAGLAAALRPSAPARTPAFTPAFVALVVCSWVAFGVWGTSTDHLDHARTLTTWRDVALFAIGWLVMVTAMMLPAATALFATVGGLAGRSWDAVRVHGTVGAGFASVWVLVGLAFRAGDVIVHTAIDATGVRLHSGTIAAALLLLSGVHQFSSSKRRCLVRCRSPRGLVIRLWSGRHRTLDAFRIGSSYGWSCVGCCWALMLLAFALAAANPAWMLVLGLVMAVEKNVRGARRFSSAVGVALIAGGALAFASA